MKSRGMRHSNQVREFIISEKGLDLVDVYLGPEGVLTGSARETQRMHQEAGLALRDHAVGRKDREVERKRAVFEAKVASLREELESVEEELNRTYVEDNLRNEVIEKNRAQMTRNRHNED